MFSHHINKTVNQREDKKRSHTSYLHHLTRHIILRPAHALDHPLKVEENLEPVGASHAEVDLTVKKVELSTSALGRTIRDTE